MFTLPSRPFVIMAYTGASPETLASMPPLGTRARVLAETTLIADSVQLDAFVHSAWRTPVVITSVEERRPRIPGLHPLSRVLGTPQRQRSADLPSGCQALRNPASARSRQYGLRSLLRSSENSRKKYRRFCHQTTTWRGAGGSRKGNRSFQYRSARGRSRERAM